jgi:hypothetical protein
VREKLLKEIESEVREKLLKEFEQKNPAKNNADDSANLTASLTGARSTGSDSKLLNKAMSLMMLSMAYSIQKRDELSANLKGK